MQRKRLPPTHALSISSSYFKTCKGVLIRHISHAFLCAYSRHISVAYLNLFESCAFAFQDCNGNA